MLESIKWTVQILNGNAFNNIYRTEVSVTVREYQVDVRVLKWNYMINYISD